MIVNPRRLVSQAANASSTQSVTPSADGEAMAVRLRLIGQMEAWTLSSDSILPTGRKTRALLAILALSAPRPVLRGKLAEMLWSRRPEEQARASLRQEIHRLLDALGPVGPQILAINRDHLMLRPGAVWVDVEEVLRASTAKPAALCLLDGDLLEDLDGVDPAFDNWLAAERERLRDRARLLAEAMLRETADPQLVIPAAQQLLSIDRAHEGAWRALMRAYAGQGERGMAIQAFERCRAVLSDLLDAQPSDETQRLAAEIRATVPGARPRGATGFSAPPALRLEPSRDLRAPAGLVMAGLRPEPAQEPRALPAFDAAGRASLGYAAGIAPVGSPGNAPRGGAARSGPRIGVLPLQLAGVSEAHAQFSTGLADDITAGLSAFRWTVLISSSSLARFAVHSRDETAIRDSFGIDFLLDGSIQPVPGRLRISLRLLDLRAGNQIVWSRRFDRDSADLLALQDEVAAEVAAQVDPEILSIEAQRVAAWPPVDPTAYDLTMRAVALTTRLEKAPFLQAGGLLRQAMALEPDFGAAFAYAALWHCILVSQGWAEHPAQAAAEAGRLAERAVMLDPQDAKALTVAGHVRAVLGHRLHEAVALHDRALQLNPNLAMAWCLSGVAHAYLGDLDEAERRVRRYKALSPFDPQAYLLDTALIVVDLLRHQHHAAVASGRQTSEMSPGFAAACLPYLAALGHLGLTQEAEMVHRRLLAIRPDFSLTQFEAAQTFARPEDLAHYLSGLRLAGVAG